MRQGVRRVVMLGVLGNKHRKGPPIWPVTASRLGYRSSGETVRELIWQGRSIRKDRQPTGRGEIARRGGMPLRGGRHDWPPKDKDKDDPAEPSPKDNDQDKPDESSSAPAAPESE